MKYLNPQITTGGLCHSFNAVPQQDLFKSSRYMKDFIEVFKPSDKKQPLYSNGFGPSSGFFMVLNTRELLESQADTKEATDSFIRKTSPNFLVSVGDSHSAFDLVRQGITVKPGFRTRIKVMQSQVLAADALGELSLEDRNCRFPHENEGMKLLSNYSLNGCEFECAVKLSHETCGCLPWNIPKTDSEYAKTPVCDMFGSYCYHEALMNVS